ncbi:hypothetical protein C6P46_005037 [Rhodotorula mucilaginosa]|uniref:Uncharacterized protein n=1 Tax=Rhodotorula mucilaginosa TaxID=5537 RepID=A0A9P6VZR4_RHOMI|nr:hypothetical protein C6P46_005037 [Rhodotorula mucilaginosa]
MQGRASPIRLCYAAAIRFRHASEARDEARAVLVGSPDSYSDFLGPSASPGAHQSSPSTPMASIFLGPGLGGRPAAAADFSLHLTSPSRHRISASITA